MSSGSITAMAYAAFVGMLLIASVLVVATDLRVQDLGPVIVYGVAVVSVLLLLLAPTKRAR